MQAAGLKGARLSSQQARLWSLQQQSHALCLVRAEGPLDKKSLREALQLLVERHEIFRTLFYRMPDLDFPVQLVVESQKSSSCRTLNLEALDALSQELIVERLFVSLRDRHFDLASGPLVYVWLVQLASARHLLLVCLPGLCADATTLRLFIEELFEIYAHRPQAEEPLQYADVSAWQDESLADTHAQGGHHYWQKLDLSALSAVPPPFVSEAGEAWHIRQSEAQALFQPRTYPVCLTKAQAERIFARASQAGVSPLAWLLATWQVALWRLTGQAHLPIGLACDGRQYDELAHAPGPYTRFVPLGVNVEKDRSFRQTVSLVERAVRDAVNWQLSFSWDTAVTTTGRQGGALPFFPLCFEYHAWPGALTAETLTVRLVRQHIHQEPFALKLQVLQTGAGLALSIAFDERRIASELVGRLAAVFSVLLESVATSPERAIGALPLLSPSDQAALLHSFQVPAPSYPQATLQQLFEEQAARHPDRVALMCGEECLTYLGTNARANQLARALRRHGAGPNRLVGLSLERSAQMLVCLLAILKAGAAYVPLDPVGSATRLLDQLRQSGSELLLTRRMFLARLSGWQGTLFCLEERNAEVAAQSEANLDGVNTLQDLAYVIYTSGSTGVPKGVMIRHQSVTNYTLALCALLEAQPGWHFATVSTLAADLGNTAIFCSLVSGGCLHILDYETITSSQAFARYMRSHPLDVLKIVPSHLSALVASEEALQLLPARALILGGEVFSLKLLARLRELGGTARIYNHYGPTETTIGALVNPVDPGETFMDQRPAAVPLGRPIAGTEAYVLGSGLHLLPVGVVGELYLGGVGLAAGYLGQPEQTADRFIPHPFAALPGARLYRTGDLACYMAEGMVTFIGRSDLQVKLRGYRVEPGEIEAAVRAYPQVKDCVVIARHDEHDEPRLVSYVVPRYRPAPAREDLRAFLLERLPEYMLPAAFVFLEALPLTLNGKIDRQRLPEPQMGEPGAQATFTLPRTPVEEILWDIWRDLLALPTLDIYENFFQAGGHSLLATQVISQIRAILHVDISIRSLFESPTVAQLAQQVMLALRSGRAAELPAPEAQQAQEAPLSFAQQRLWFLDQLQPASTAYLIPRAFRLRGPLNVRALSGSLAELVRRHQSLRTTFQERAGQPVQVIHRFRAFCLPLVDVRGLDEARREIVIHELAGQEARRPCDLVEGPLLRVLLLRVQDQEHVLFLTQHHIISDGWSIDVVLRELALLYPSQVHGTPCTLPELPIQYADFARWQRQWLDGPFLELQLSYWTEQLRDLAPLELPADYPRPALQSSRGAWRSRILPAELTALLRLLSQEHGVTLFMLLLAAFQCLLARYSGQTDIALGTPVANRGRPEIDNLVGFLANTLVLRTDLAGNPSFLELLARVREVALGAYTHQDVPFEKLVEALQPERDLSRTPLFQVMFLYQAPPPAQQPLPGLVLEPLPSAQTTAQFDLSFTVQPLVEGLLCHVEYSTDLFAEGTIDRLLDHWQILLRGICAHPEQQLLALPLLTAQEHRQLLTLGSSPARALPAASCLHQLIEERAAMSPDAVAMRCAETCLTYERVNARANALAAHLRQHGAGPECLIAVCAERSLPWLLAMLAIFKSGGAYLPLDPHQPRSRLKQMLAQSKCQIVLVGQQIAPLLQVCAVTDEQIQVFVLEQALDLSQKMFSGENVPCWTTPRHLAYVIYTSGSTGEPKGVMVEHRGMLNHALAKSADVGLGANDILAHNGPQSFDVSIWQGLAPLVWGGVVELLPDELAFAPVHLGEQLHERAITVLQLVPALLSGLLAALADLPAAGRPALPALRWVVPTGEALPVSLCQLWWQAYPQIPLMNTYGSTECSDDQCHYCLWGLTPAEARRPVISLGRPISNLRVYVLDRLLNQVPINVTGEIYIGGVGVGRGYLDDPVRTALAFLPDPFEPRAGERLYRTGDLARYTADGCLEFVGRRDQRVKVRGYRIELGDLEAALLRHPQVRQCVALARESADGQADRQLVAYIVPQQFPGPPAHDLRVYLRTCIPEYMLPGAFVMLESLPLNANGKVDRRALPVPAAESCSPESSWESRSPLEEMVAVAWGDILEQEPHGIHENFFARGGHSLLATRLIARLQSVLGIRLAVRTLFETPTIAGLARQVALALRGEQQLTEPVLLPVARHELLPLSFAQQRLWFLDQLDPGNIAYLIPTARRLEGALKVRALERALSYLIQRHESLRTTFRLHADQPVQVIHPAVSFVLPLIDLRGLEQPARERQVRTLAAQEMQVPCDLSTGPLLRCSLLRLRGEDHVLLFTLHHIISDAWSGEIFYRELTLLYQSFVARRPSPLAPLALQYADFAVWQRQWLQGALLETQLAYWKQQLAEAPMLDLPLDYARPPRQTFRGAARFLPLALPLREQLQALARREGVTLFMLLLAAFQVLLARSCRQEDISVGTAITNRSRAELEDVIGFFANTLPLRTSLQGNPSFCTLLHRVREVTLGAYAHQDVPFEQIVEALQLERDLSRSPLFQVTFHVHHLASMREEPAGLVLSGLDAGQTTTKFDLSLAMLESEEEFLCRIIYNIDLFKMETIDLFLERWQVLLQGIVASPDARLMDLRLLTPAEEQRLLHEWSTDGLPPYPDACLHTLVEAQANRTPDAIALASAELCLTYAVFNQLADHLACLLLARHLSPQQAVALYVPPSCEAAIALLGLLKAGAVSVPLDLTFPPERLAWMLSETDAAFILTRSELASSLPQTSARQLCLDTLWPELLAQPLRPRPFDVGPRALASILYTSGSTGRPKGVMIAHRAMANRLQWGIDDSNLRAGDRVAQLAGWSFDISLWELFGPWMAGATVLLSSPEMVRDSRALLAYVRQQQATVVHAVPSLLNALLQEPDIVACTGIRRIQCGGETVTADLLRRLFASLPVSVDQFYGPTEAAISVTRWRGTAPEDLAHLDIGRPTTGARLYLLDQAWRLAPQGTHAEIWIGGLALSAGYLLRPEQTAERFVPDPFSGEPGARLYRTGDLGRYTSAGTLAFAGRSDSQVKIRGHRVDPGEIEAVFLEYFALTGCAVLAREDVPGEVQLVAYPVRDPAGEVPSEEQVREQLRARLPEYMLPSRVIWLDALPLTSTGKVDRRALPSPQEATRAQSVAPRNPLEELLGVIWKDILHLPSVGVDDDFFELGGHSLLATRLASRIQQAVGVNVSVQDLFETVTIAGLAEQLALRIRTDQRIALPELVAGERPGWVPLSFAQQRLWFLDQLQPGSSAYVIPSARRLGGALSVRSLNWSLDQLVERHESLRTILPVVQGSPVQQIEPARGVCLPLIDVSGLEQEDRHRQQRVLLHTEVARPFDLGRGPLLRSWLLRLERQEHVLLLNLHHSITDGWSMQIVLRELAALYRAALAGQGSPLAPLPVQYADYALWQRQWLRGEVLEKHLAYWKNQLAGASELPLPTDFPRPHIQNYRGAGYRFSLSTDLSARLLALASQENVTGFMLLLAAFQALLYRWTGQPDIVVGTDVANRNHVETEQLIGFFINLLALRGDLRGSPGFRSLLQRTREMVLGAYAHREVPFEMLVEHLHLRRHMNQTPLIRALFVLQNLPASYSELLPGLTVESVEGEAETAKFDLALFLHEARDGLHGAVVYQTSLFQGQTIAALMSRFELLLRQVVSQPDSSIDVLDIETEEDRRQKARLARQMYESDIQSLRASKGEEIDLGYFQTQQKQPEE